MNFINFNEEFSKVARKAGMGEAIDGSYVCYMARKILKEDFSHLDAQVTQYKDNVLLIGCSGSSALAAFSLEKNKVKEVMLNNVPKLTQHFEIRLRMF